MSRYMGLQCILTATALATAGCYTKSVTVVDGRYRWAPSADAEAFAPAADSGDALRHAQDAAVVSLSNAGDGALWRVGSPVGVPSRTGSLEAGLARGTPALASDSRFRSGGPRMGLILVTGDAADVLETERDASPLLTAWGWQFEYQYESAPGGPTGLVEVVPMVCGLEQGLVLPTVNVLFGLRTASDWEVSIGPNIGVKAVPAEDAGDEADVGVGIGLTAAVGKTFRVGELNLPVNFAIVSNESGPRFSITMGWNIRQ